MRYLMLLAIFFGVVGLADSADAQRTNNIRYRVREVVKSTDYNPRTMPRRYKEGTRWGHNWFENVTDGRRQSRVFTVRVRNGDLIPGRGGFEAGSYSSSSGTIQIWHKTSNVTLTMAHEIGHGMPLGPTDSTSHLANSIIGAGVSGSKWRLRPSQTVALRKAGYMTESGRLKWNRRYANGKQVRPKDWYINDGRKSAADPSLPGK